MFMLVEGLIFTKDKKEKIVNEFGDLHLMIKDRGKSFIVEGPRCPHNLMIVNLGIRIYPTLLNGFKKKRPTQLHPNSKVLLVYYFPTIQMNVSVIYIHQNQFNQGIRLAVKTTLHFSEKSYHRICIS